MSNHNIELVEAALEYAPMGWQVFPCHPTGHQPLVKRGFYAATTDEQQIQSWWSEFPDAAIGLRTGQESGVFAVDVDPRNGGDVSLELLEDKYEKLPETVESQTGGGGRHLLLNWPGRVVPCSAGKVGSGIDIKGDGGYIILPPSDHKSGKKYCWLIEQEPGECKIAEAPAWLLGLIEQDTPIGTVASENPETDDVIPEGYRNTTLASQAGHMRQIGMTAEEIVPALRAINNHRCKPPLEAAEVDRIAASIGRYDPDTSRQAQVECWPERFLNNLGNVTEWPDPKPIPEDLPPVKAFDPVLLPSTVWPWVVDIAERMQCPIEFPAVCAMVALAAIIGRRAAIRPLQRDDWTEYVNLWVMLIGRPSMMKSPPMKKVLAFIRVLTEAARDEYKAAMKVYERQRELADIKAKQAKRKVEATLAKGEDIEALSDGLVPDLPEKPKRRRYVVNDTTVEALAEVLSENPNGVLVERDEMMGFLQSLDRPGQNGAREFYLESWAGNACFESDRTHARRIYSVGIDPGVAHARALAKRIQQGDVADGFTLRDVYHGRHWSMLADAAQVQMAVDELIELGWLRVEEVATSGRPAKKHRINPKALAMTT